jgi:hypothetical protein
VTESPGDAVTRRRAHTGSVGIVEDLVFLFHCATTQRMIAETGDVTESNVRPRRLPSRCPCFAAGQHNRSLDTAYRPVLPKMPRIPLGKEEHAP